MRHQDKQAADLFTRHSKGPPRDLPENPHAAKSQAGIWDSFVFS